MKTTEMREPWISVEGVLYDFDQGIITQTQARDMIKKYVTSDYERHHSHSHCPEKDSPCGIQGSHRCCLCEEPVKEELCAKCRAPFLSHHHVHTTRTGKYHTACYQKTYKEPQEVNRLETEPVNNEGSQEVEWEKELEYHLGYNLMPSKTISEVAKPFISTLLADKAKVLREEIGGRIFVNPNEAGQFSLHTDGYNQALEDVLETITRILR